MVDVSDRRIQLGILHLWIFRACSSLRIDGSCLLPLNSFFNNT